MNWISFAFVFFDVKKMNLGCLKDFTFVYAPIKVMSAGQILNNDNLLQKYQMFVA